MELLLLRAASLLTKFSRDSVIVEEILGNTESQYLEIESYESRMGILNAINLQQDRNSGKKNSNLNDFPYASVRENILRNRNDSNPCQLTVCIGGTHDLENGGNNSIKGRLEFPSIWFNFFSMSSVSRTQSHILFPRIVDAIAC